MSKSKLRRLEVQYKARIEELVEENKKLATENIKLHREIKSLKEPRKGFRGQTPGSWLGGE